MKNESQKVKDFLSWLKDEWIECKPNQGCLKCDELRDRITALENDEEVITVDDKLK